MFKFIFAFILSFSPIVWSNVIYVPNDYTTIQSAIDVSTEGDTILVSPGIYYENIYFKGNNIVLASNFIFSSDTNDINITIIDGSLLTQGDSLGSVIRIFSGETIATKITGFTIQKGKGVKSGNYSPTGRRGGGVLVENAGVTLSNNVIINNTAEADNYSKGGGICLIDSPANIFSNQIVNNISKGFNYGYGGGIYSSGIIEVTIQNNLIIDNFGDGIILFGTRGLIDSNIIANNVGRGIWAQTHYPRVSNNKIHDNTDYGIAVNYGLLYIEYNTIYNNGGGISSRASHMDITNNTIVKNNGPALYKFWWNTTNISFVNNISWGNNNYGEQIILEEGVNFTILHNDVEGGENNISFGTNINIVENIGNFSDDPLFCDYQNNNFHLDNFSPCLNAGLNENLVGALGIGCSTLCGDINNDAVVDINDVTAYLEIYFICGAMFQITQVYDMNCNNRIDLADLIILAESIFGYSSNTCCK